MKKDVMLPQGKFKIGRDLPAGIYLMAGLNDFSCVTIKRTQEDTLDMYTLDEDNTKMVHIEVCNGDIVEIEGKVKVRQIKTASECGAMEFNLIKDVEQFEVDLKRVSAKKSSNAVTHTQESDEEEIYDADDESNPKKKGGFWNALASLVGSSSKKRYQSM